jgi:hypothetical protein
LKYRLFSSVTLEVLCRPFRNLNRFQDAVMCLIPNLFPLHLTTLKDPFVALFLEFPKNEVREKLLDLV